jgi:peptidoglycan/xylan/chitin deacetylase (PgdA/CDA1 family)
MVRSVTIHNDIQEPYVEYGLEHFVNKFGLTYSAKPQDADIYIGCSIPEHCNSKIQILQSQNVIEKPCFMTLKNETVPIFQKPQRINSEYNLGSVDDGADEYACWGRTNNRIIFGFDIFGEIGRFLAGHYDTYFLGKDKLGDMLKLVPVVDVIEESLYDGINQIFGDGQQKLQYFSWPDHHKFALVLTHDVDRAYKTFQYLPSIINSIRKIRPVELGYHLSNLCFNRGIKNPYWTFDSICELENSLGVKSTYYFLNEKGKPKLFDIHSWILYRGIYDVNSSHIKTAITSLSNRGHEIGVHGSYDSFTDYDRLKTEKETLESITGSKVKGIRQHYLNFNKKSTPDLHKRSGFVYDSTLGFKPENGAMGFRRGSSFPFRMMLPDMTVSPVLEIPLIIMDGALDAEYTYEDCLKVISRVEKYHGVLTILWHTNRFNPREYPTMGKIYKDIVNEAKSRDAWITTADKVCDWMSG